MAAYILDAHLPGKSVVAIAAELATQPDAPPLMVFAAPGKLPSGLQLGDDALVERPVRLDNLYRRLARVLGRRKAVAGAVVTGRLADLPLQACLAALAIGGRTALIQVTGESESGLVQVREGRPASAAHGNREGVEALRTLLSDTTGSFEVRFADSGRSDLDGTPDDTLDELCRRGGAARG